MGATLRIRGSTKNAALYDRLDRYLVDKGVRLRLKEGGRLVTFLLDKRGERDRLLVCLSYKSVDEDDKWIVTDDTRALVELTYLLS